MNLDAAEFLSGIYQPPLQRFPTPARHPHQYAKAAVWGQALADWLGGYEQEVTRQRYRHAVGQLLNFCRKLPWEVRQADVAGWLEVGLAEMTQVSKYDLLQPGSLFYRFACARSWTSPAGRRLKLCRADPTAGVARPRRMPYLRLAVLSEPELQRLLAAFDRDTPFGRRDYALFTVMLATGLPLHAVLQLRLQDLVPPPDPQCWGGKAGPEFGGPAAWQAVQAYLEADGRLATMAPDDYLFNALEDVAGLLARKHPQDWQRRPLTARFARRAFKAYVRWADLDEERVTPETLRYTGACRLLQCGAGVQEVARFLRLKDLYWAGQVVARLQLLTPVDAPHRDPLGLWVPQSLRRRRKGAQPGNKNRMVHGAKSARFRLSSLGIRWRQFHLLKDADLPRIIVDLRVMLWELLELPEDSLMNTVKKLNKAGYIVFIRGLLKAYYYKRRLQAGGRFAEEDGD